METNDSIISLENISRFLDNIKVTTVQKEDGKGLSSNDFSEDWMNKVQTAYDHSRSIHFPPDDPIDLTTAINRLKLNNLPISSVSSRVLITTSADTDPIWGQVSQQMLANNSVGSAQIINGSVESNELATDAVTTNKISNGAVTTPKIADRNITTEKVNNRAITGNELFTSSINNRVLTVSNGPSTDPVWGQIIQQMMAPNSVGVAQIIDAAVTTPKIADSNVTTEKIAAGAVINEKILNNTIRGIKLESSSTADVVMAVRAGNSTPTWQQINSAMISDLNVITNKIADLAITTEKLGPLSVTTAKVANRAIDGRTLFSSDKNNRVLVVKTANNNPEWLQITQGLIATGAVGSDQIIDGAVTTSKLGLMAVTRDRIADESINQNKLLNAQIIDTNRIVDKSITSAKLADGAVLPTGMPDNTIPGVKLLTSPTADVVMAVREVNGEPNWKKVTGAMIADSTITNTKFADFSVGQIKLENSPIIDTARLVNQSVTSAKLSLQSVITDRIADGAVTTSKLADNSVSTSKMIDGSVTKNKIASRAISGSELFTTSVANSVLIVPSGGADPIWGQLGNSMIADNSVEGIKLKTSPTADVVMAVRAGNSTPTWQQINSAMISDLNVTSAKLAIEAVTVNKLATNSVTNIKVNDKAIDGRTLFSSSTANRVLIVGAVDSDPVWGQIVSGMISNSAVQNAHILNDTIEPSKLNSTNNFLPRIGNGYGVNTEGASVLNRVVSIPNFVRQIGSCVQVKFTNTISVPDGTLNINNTGRSNIQIGGANIGANVIPAGATVEFVFDGTVWEILGGLGSPIEVHKIGAVDTDVMSGFIGYTCERGDGAGTNGEVTKALFSIPFKTIKSAKPTVTLSGSFKVRLGNHTLQTLSAGTVVGITTSCATVEFTLSTSHPSNSPCMLVFADNNSIITVTP